MLRDAVTGMSVLSKMCNSSWWNWSLGSTLAFWRWPEGEQRRAFWDGMYPYCQSEPPAFKPRFKQPKPEVSDLLLPKFQAIIARGYEVSKQDSTEQLPSSGDFIASNINFFEVPKDKDIRSSRTGQVAVSTRPSGHQTFGCLRPSRPLEF